jgi:SAM-dependent methyltransferase
MEGSGFAIGVLKMKMKGRESGMPEENYWDTFFDPDLCLKQLLGHSVSGDIVEFGCGYGTFTIPASKLTQGIVTALDIEQEMIERVQQKIISAEINNLNVVLRDFVVDGTGLPEKSQAHAMIFNLLHIENPVELLLEAHRVLDKNASISVIHWRRDIPTPRGPSLEIRPSPKHCNDWLEAAGFRDVTLIDLQASCPFHFGMVAYK